MYTFVMFYISICLYEYGGIIIKSRWLILKEFYRGGQDKGQIRN